MRRLLMLSVVSVAAACSESPNVAPETARNITPRDMAAIAAPYAGPPGASVPVTVTVPPSLAAPPFDVPRTLTLPPGFTIEVVARVNRARFLLLLPGGDFLVSQPATGTITLVRPSTTGGVAQTFTFAAGLRGPHDMLLARIGGQRYVYVAETKQITRALYRKGDTAMGARTVVVSGLPDATTPGLGGAYGHELKNIAYDGAGSLYVSIASTCNVCLGDGTANPVRASIYKYSATGSGATLFARGLRNAEGLAFVPGTKTLWVTVNNRDNIPYPFNDASGNYGKVLPSYVDDHPPELFTNVVANGDYGWPFCNSNPDTPSGYDNMPFDIDYTFRQQGVNCATKTRAAKGIQAHSAPLGLHFLQSTSFASAYRNGVVIALHGSWNRTQPTGYKIIYFPWNASTQRPLQQTDFVTGWLSGGSVWGRPVDVAMDGTGGMLISDDGSGTIYRLKPTT